MHEASIAANILSIAREVAEREGASRILGVDVEIGALSLIDLDSLKFALEVLSRGTIAEGLEAKFRIVKARFKCRQCEKVWSAEVEDVGSDDILLLHSYPELASRFFKCPNCGSPDFDIIEGLDVKLLRVRLEKE